MARGRWFRSPVGILTLALLGLGVYFSLELDGVLRRINPGPDRTVRAADVSQELPRLTVPGATVTDAPTVIEYQCTPRTGATGTMTVAYPGDVDAAELAFRRVAFAERWSEDVEAEPRSQSKGALAYTKTLGLGAGTLTAHLHPVARGTSIDVRIVGDILNRCGVNGP